MSRLVYRIVQHDGGWAYTADGVFSETYPNLEAALARARIVAAEQRAPGEAEAIEYEDEAGRWITEQADGRDRPDTEVRD